MPIILIFEHCYLFQEFALQSLDPLPVTIVSKAVDNKLGGPTTVEVGTSNRGDVTGEQNFFIGDGWAGSVKKMGKEVRFQKMKAGLRLMDR